MVYLIHEDREQWAEELKQAIYAELKRLGIEVHLDFSYELEKTTELNHPAIAIYLSSENGCKSNRCRDAIRAALSFGILIIPVIESGIDFMYRIPRELNPINAFIWSGISPADKLSRRYVLPELGLSEKERKVFISYRRSDGLSMADQLFDALSRRGFTTFMDLYDIESGRNVQREIVEYLESIAFVLVIESPDAHRSKWIYNEVNFALQHHMGISIIHCPSANLIPNTNDLPRINIINEELINDGKYKKFSDCVLPYIINEIEFCHADGLLRRRRYLLESVENEAQLYYNTCLNIGNWTLFLHNGTNQKEDTIIEITPRTPSAQDLYCLDNLSLQLNNISQVRKLLIHSTSYMSQDRTNLLGWVINNRLMEIFHLDHFIGGCIL